MLTKLIMYIAAFFGIMTGLDWLYKSLDIQSPSQVWAMTFVTILLIILIAMTYCVFRQENLVKRIHDCAMAKSKLERAILKKRLSSKG